MDRRLQIGLLEDDASQSALITSWLEAAGHQVTGFRSGREIVKELRSAAYDLLVLDWELPDFSGLDVLVWARMRHYRDTPIIVLTHRSSGQDAAAALRAGANDFIRKPADRNELLARVDTVTARRATLRRTSITLGQFHLDRNAGFAWRGKEQIPLTAIQFALAWHLFENAGQVVPRERLHVAVWGRPEAIESRTLDAHISNLRMKLGIRPENGLKISALYSYGYRIEICEGHAGA